MNPEQLQQLKEVYEWMQTRKKQQFSYPLDDASKNTLSEGAVLSDGPGATTLDQSIGLSGAPEVITVPAPFVGSVKILAGGVEYEVPAIAIS